MNWWRPRGGRVASYRQLHSLTAHHEATQSVVKMLIHISVALSATVMWLTYSHIQYVAIKPHLMWL